MKRIAVSSILVALLATAAWPQQGQSGSSQQPAQKNAQTTPTPENSKSEKAVTESSKEAAGEKSAAEEAGDPNAQFTQSPSVKALGRLLGVSTGTAYLISVILNFAIVAVGVLILAKKFLPSILQARNEAIQKGLEEARRSSEDASKRLRDIEARLGRLGNEITALHAEAAAQSKDEEERIKAGTEEEKARIISSAEQEIAAAAASARRELQSYAAELAVTLAEKKISIDVSTDKGLVRDFVEQLGKDGR